MSESERSLSEYLDATPASLRKWVWDLAVWGKPALVAAACAAARRAFPVLSTHRDPAIQRCFEAPSILASLQAAESWLADPGVETLSAVRSAVAAASDDLHSIMLNVDEASGSSELVLARERAHSAAAACVMAAETAVWTPEDSLPAWAGDELELEARRKAGPAYEASQAVSHACHALDLKGVEFARMLAADIRPILLK